MRWWGAVVRGAVTGLSFRALLRVEGETPSLQRDVLPSRLTARLDLSGAATRDRQAETKGSRGTPSQFGIVSKRRHPVASA